MRIAFHAKHPDATAGGMHTFEQNVLKSLEEKKLPFDVLVLSRFHIDTKLPQRILSHQSNWFGKEVSYNDALIEEKIDLVWFLGGFEETSLPYVFTVLDLAHRRYPEFPEVSIQGWSFEEREVFFNKAIPRAYRVIVGTNAGAAEIHEGYRVLNERIKVIPFSATPLPKFEEKVEKVTFPYFLYPAQFWPHKNHIVLLEALSELRKSSGSVPDLVFVGSDKGNLKYIQKRADELNLSDKVIFPGFVSRSQLRWLYLNSSALLFPSFFGPDNLPPLEAFQLGCPVLASDIYGASEQLGAGALLISPTDSSAWAMAMRSILEDSALRERLKVSGLAIAEAHSLESYADSIIETIIDFGRTRRCWELGS